MLTERQKEALDLRKQGLSLKEISQHLGINHRNTLALMTRAEAAAKKGNLDQYGYNLDVGEKTPAQAWAEHSSAFERKAGKVQSAQWRKVSRDGPFVIYHTTDQHIDDDGAALNVLADDIARSHDMGAIMVHGGDALNNWPVAGRLAKKWADQECTMPTALLRLQHFIDILKPDVWVDGNHEEMNPYLSDLIKTWLPEKTIRDYWTARFVVETPNALLRCVVSHKLAKGSSWFHKLHGHLREILEGEPADLLMDGHLHSDGVLDQTMPEQGRSTLCVASAGYKLYDDFATRISRGGKKAGLRGRAHWIVADDQADDAESPFVAFKSARQAEAYLNGLQNLRAA